MKKLFPILLVGVLFVFSGCDQATSTTASVDCDKCKEECPVETKEQDCTNKPIEGVVFPDFTGKLAQNIDSYTDSQWGIVKFPDHINRNLDRCYLSKYDTIVIGFPAINSWGYNDIKMGNWSLGDFLRIPANTKAPAVGEYYAFVDMAFTTTNPANPKTDPNPPNDGENKLTAFGPDDFSIPRVKDIKIPEGVTLTEDQKTALSDKNGIPIILPVYYPAGINKPYYQYEKELMDNPAKFNVIFYELTPYKKTGDIYSKDPDGKKQTFAAAIHITFY